MTNEQYIEHEVKLRVLEEVNTERYRILNKMMADMNNKFSWMITFIIGSIIIPIFLHHYNMI